MSNPRTPAQGRHLDSPTRPEGDLPEALAHRMRELSEAAHAFASDHSWLAASRRDRLLRDLRDDAICEHARLLAAAEGEQLWRELLSRSRPPEDRKSTRLNSSHVEISYAV